MHHKKTDSIDEQMRVVRDFIDEFYNKTVFKNGRGTDADLTPTVIKALFSFTDDSEAYPIGALGKNARVKSSTITDMVDRLERDGLAERVRDSSDRRVVNVRLTDKGKKVKSEFTNKRRAEFQSIFSKLQEKETQRLVHHLNEAYKLLKKIK